MIRAWHAPATSLGLRLVVLFALGSALIMAGAGYTLYHALGMQLDERDLAEINGKTEVVQHQLAGIARADQLAAHVGQFREITVGHPHLSIGIRSGSIWLLRPLPAVASLVQAAPELPAGKVSRLGDSHSRWWLRRVPHAWTRPQPAAIDVFVAVEVTDSQRILRQHRLVALGVGLLGTLSSGLLAFLVVRRGLRPLYELAAKAEQLNADGLGAPLHVDDAPDEIRSVVASLNRMLARLHDSFRSLEQFSADIAHELRTPLNHLLLRTQVTLSRPRAGTEYQEALLANLEELERLQRMVADMLFLARADRGMLPLRQETIELAAETASVAEFFEPLTSENRQTIQLSGGATVQGDRLMLRRALTNLLSNAVRYSPPGARIEVEIATSEGAVVLTVRNPGAAMPPEALAGLFARFTRGHDSARSNAEGVGLGLAIVDSIMRLHGGRVEADCQEGRYRFSLVFAAGQRPPDGDPRRP